MATSSSFSKHGLLIAGAIMTLLAGSCVVLGFIVGFSFDSGQTGGEIGTIFLVIGLIINALAGYIGLAILFIKGWTLETLGCLLITGGSLLLLVAGIGLPIFFISAVLPNRRVKTI